MGKFTRLILVIFALALLTACTSERNQYGAPATKWEQLPPRQQDLIRQTNQQMVFNDYDYEGSQPN
jgi:hypothetical protein